MKNTNLSIIQLKGKENWDIKQLLRLTDCFLGRTESTDSLGLPDCHEKYSLLQFQKKKKKNLGHGDVDIENWKLSRAY